MMSSGDISIVHVKCTCYDSLLKHMNKMVRTRHCIFLICMIGCEKVGLQMF
jgi:hypothetical protein